MTLPADDTRSLALLYHLNSEPWLNAEAYAAEGYEVQVSELREPEEAIALPAGEGGLLDLLRRRESCRSFAPRELAAATLGGLLAGTYAPARLVTFPTGIEMDARTVPSAGGLYPLEVYLLLRRVEGIADGAYHYRVREHALEPLAAPPDRDSLSGALLAEPFLEHANAIVMFSAVLDRTLHKYGARGYRYILLEAGHAAQNLCLLAAERGLSSLCVGGFMDARMNELLGLELGREAVVYCVGVGHAAVGAGPGRLSQ
jgi:SagB-type dehydrogenase family enzyme